MVDKTILDTVTVLSEDSAPVHSGEHDVSEDCAMFEEQDRSNIHDKGDTIGGNSWLSEVAEDEMKNAGDVDD